MSAVFCIAEHEKLSSFGAIAGSAAHNFRTMVVENADPARTGQNITIGPATPKELIKATKARLATLEKKPRSNSVLVLEYLVTFSPQWADMVPAAVQMQYLRDGVAWLRQRHGEENVLSENYQLDEKTLHAVLYVVPITPDGRLACRDFTGGPDKCRKFKTDFWKAVGAKYGLLRGVEGSKSRHTTAKQFNGMLAKAGTWKVPARPEISKLDWVTGNGNAKLQAYADKLAGFAAWVEKRNDLADHLEKARVQQNKGLIQLREKLAKLEKSEVRALQLEAANQILVDELEAEKRSAQEAKDTTARLARKLEALQSAMAVTSEESDLEEDWAPANR